MPSARVIVPKSAALSGGETCMVPAEEGGHMTAHCAVQVLAPLPGNIVCKVIEGITLGIDGVWSPVCCWQP